MIWINENCDILSESEKKLLKNKCNNFIVTDMPIFIEQTRRKNYYNRNFLDIKDNKIKKILDKITNEVKSIFKINTIYSSGIWINKIDSKSNKNDGFHRDSAEFTFLLYLNENFEGGEFEYIDEKDTKIKIKPKNNMCIISKKELLHRVLPVISGERFSLVTFFKTYKKDKITLI